MSRLDPTELRAVTHLAQSAKHGAEGTAIHRPELVVEAPVAIVLNGTTAAVMMTTPADLEDFARGFALTEGYISDPAEIEHLEIVDHEAGIEARLWLPETKADAFRERRRIAAGPVGCGLCGIESLEAVHRSLPKVSAALPLTESDILTALESLAAHQPLKDRTRSTHAAGFFQPGRGIRLAREDVGRHNALDKLIGALSATGEDPTSGAVVITSRVSVELVQKTAIFGAPMLIAASGPTSLAVETAKNAGITLIGFCRGGGFERFS